MYLFTTEAVVLQLYKSNMESVFINLMFSCCRLLMWLISVSLFLYILDRLISSLNGLTLVILGTTHLVEPPRT